MLWEDKKSIQFLGIKLGQLTPIADAVHIWFNNNLLRSNKDKLNLVLIIVLQRAILLSFNDSYSNLAACINWMPSIFVSWFPPR
jgi:hypothetical protein